MYVMKLIKKFSSIFLFTRSFFSLIGFQASLDIVAEAVRLHGPFQGVISFSQGSALTALIVLRAAVQKLKDKNVPLDEKTLACFNAMDIRFPKELMSFDFAILFSGFRSHSSRHSAIYEVIMN